MNKEEIRLRRKIQRLEKIFSASLHAYIKAKRELQKAESEYIRKASEKTLNEKGITFFND